MEYAVIKTHSSHSAYDLIKALINEAKVMYQSVLYPYVDALILSRETDVDIYFSDKIIVKLDFLKKESFTEFMRDFDDAVFEIKPRLLTNDLESSVKVSDCYSFFCDYSFDIAKSHEVRLASRNLSALAEIAQRIIHEYGGEVVSTSINKIFFQVSEEKVSEVIDRLEQAKEAIYG